MFTRNQRIWRIGAVLAATIVSTGAVEAQEAKTARFGFGEPAPEQLIEKWAIAIPPSGKHLPEGGGTPAEGKKVYMNQCAACHGKNLQGIKSTGGSALIGGRGTLDSSDPKKTVESYWPYATTLFDYTRRAMPFQSPGSLTDDEVYAVTAYILHEADIIPADREMNAETLPQVTMPNQAGFTGDPRPDVYHYR